MSEHRFEDALVGLRKGEKWRCAHWGKGVYIVRSDEHNTFVSSNGKYLQPSMVEICDDSWEPYRDEIEEAAEARGVEKGRRLARKELILALQKKSAVCTANPQDRETFYCTVAGEIARGDL